MQAVGACRVSRVCTADSTPPNNPTHKTFPHDVTYHLGGFFLLPTNKNIALYEGDDAIITLPFTQELTGTEAQAVLDDIDDKLQDIHDERKSFASTTLTSGSGIVFNHALNNQFLSGLKVYESASPFADITASLTIYMTDVNNVEITNDGADVDVIVVCTK